MSVWAAVSALGATVIVCSIATVVLWMLRPEKKPIWQRKSFKKSLAWAERNGFNNWEKDSNYLAAFEEEHGRITSQPHPVSQFAVFSAAREIGYYEYDSFYSELFLTPYTTSLHAAKALEPVVGPAGSRRVLGPLLEDMLVRAEHDASGQDEFFLARVGEVLNILGSGHSVDEVLDIMRLAPAPTIGLSAFANDVSIEYAAEVLANG